MHITFSWVLYSLVGIAFVVAVALLSLRKRRSNPEAPDVRATVAVLSGLVLLQTGRYMDPDRADPDSPFVHLLFVGAFLVLINWLVWESRRKSAATSERKES